MDALITIPNVAAIAFMALSLGLSLRYGRFYETALWALVVCSFVFGDGTEAITPLCAVLAVEAIREDHK